MRRSPVVDSAIERWRGLDCLAVLNAVTDHLKEDKAFVPRECLQATRWHASPDGFDYEILCTGSRFFDTRARHGGGGAVDLLMHLFHVDFKHAVKLLRDRGL